MKEISAREIAFADACGGVLDEQIQEAEVRELLSNQPGPKLDADRILPVLANAVGWYRMMRAQDEHRLSRLQVADQARDTAAAAGNLLERLANMHPDLEAEVNDALYPLRGTHVLALHDALTPYLALIQAALSAKESQLRTEQTRRGPKRESERDIAFRRVYNALLAEQQRAPVDDRERVLLAERDVARYRAILDTLADPRLKADPVPGEAVEAVDRLGHDILPGFTRLRHLESRLALLERATRRHLDAMAEAQDKARGLLAEHERALAIDADAKAKAAAKAEVKLRVEAARGLAADLLRAAEPGMPMPTDQDELRRIAGGGFIRPETEANNPG